MFATFIIARAETTAGGTLSCVMTARGVYATYSLVLDGRCAELYNGITSFLVVRLGQKKRNIVNKKTANKPHVVFVDYKIPTKII